MNYESSNVRIEEDTLGAVEVSADHLWGAQTQRSHENFPIGVEHCHRGRPVIRALGILKKCAAGASEELNQQSREKVAESIFDQGFAQVERPKDIRTWIEGQLYRPHYQHAE